MSWWAAGWRSSAEGTAQQSSTQPGQPVTATVAAVALAAVKVTAVTSAAATVTAQSLTHPNLSDALFWRVIYVVGKVTRQPIYLVILSGDKITR